MTSIAKLKDRARKHEQEENWQAAIEAYRKILKAEEGQTELELGLFNRIGDLYLRIGQTENAVTYYEKAADKYAADGFFNNAIALCNKALRHRPDRPEIYLKLSRLCAEQGFVTDARRWILDYAERQVRAGRVDAALEGLSDFVETSGDPEVREFLAQQLASHGRRDEAVDHYARAYARRLERGETEAAARVEKKARAIDPTVDLDAARSASVADSHLEPLPGLDDAEEDTRESGREAADIGLETRSAAPDSDVELGGLELEPTGAGPAAEDDLGTDLGDELPGLEPTGGAAAEDNLGTDLGDELPGLEPTGGALAAEDDLAVELPGLEPTGGAAAAEDELADELPGLEPSYSEPQPEPALDEPETASLGGLETFDVLDLGPDDAGAGVAPVPGAGVERDAPEEEPEPLPLIDSGFGDESEEPEPLPLLDMGPEEPEPPVTPDEEDAEFPMFDLDGGLGFGGEAVEAEEVEGEIDLGSVLDLDLGSLAGGQGPEAAAAFAEDLEKVAEVEDLDARAVLARARELVSRGLSDEAMAELRLLAAAEGETPELYRDAVTVLNEVIRRDPGDLTALQHRVDFAARTGDRGILVKGYLELAEALGRTGAETKARAMYDRVLALDPDNAAALAALGGPAAEEEEAVDLDAILLEMGPGTPEVEVAEPEEPADVEADPEFAAMLSQFKARVSDHADMEDAGDHYDLGIAFKEMGLIDEAISEFQTALTAGEERLKVYEELGQCFIMKGQYTVALKVFHRALQVPHQEEAELLGVYYHLGQCHEQLGQRQEARQAYEKVLAIEPSFQDVPDRMARL